MVIGDGLIANVFNNYKNNQNILIFASGVSNSNEINQDEFEREKLSLIDSIKLDIKIIYFSSCSLEDIELKDTPYHKHKKDMEEIISKNANEYLIFRLANIVGYGGNKHNIINYLYNKILNDEYFYLWKFATRNIIDVDDLYKIICYIIDNDLFSNEIINIAYGNNTKVIEIVESLESILNIKANYKLVNKGSDMKININKISKILEVLQIHQPSIKKLIKKYKG